MSARKKQKVEEILRQELVDPATIKAVRNAWIQKDSPGDAINVVDGVEIIQYPFPVCLVRNLIPTHLIKAALAEIPSVKFFEKSNDLYQFKQTTDVANMKDVPNISDLYRIFTTEVRSWVEKTIVSEHGLKPHISATFSCYDYGDRLLCHDDKCEVRHTAFVLYLTHDWTTEHGGNLELFNTNANGDPHVVVQSIPATFNTLALFHVTPTSFHQVSEVMSRTKKRLSLNGWFHSATDSISIPLLLDSTPTLDTIPPTASEFSLEDFFLINYLKFRNQLDIKEMFVANSEIQLDEILLPDVWLRLCDDIVYPGIQWRPVGPANIRHYDVADPQTLPPLLSNLWALLQSRTWLRFLKGVTGLDMVPSTNSDTQAWHQGRQPSCRVEVQRWTRGSYSLLHDRDPEFHTSGMDVFLRVPFPGIDLPLQEQDTPEAGHVVYLDKLAQDEDCLLHLGYKMNSMGLIYRDLQTLRFTKYLDSTAAPFYQIQCLYIPWAPPSDNPRLRHVESGSETEPEPSDQEEGEEIYEEEGMMSGAEIIESELDEYVDDERRNSNNSEEDDEVEEDES